MPQVWPKRKPRSAGKVLMRRPLCVLPELLLLGWGIVSHSQPFTSLWLDRAGWASVSPPAPSNLATHTRSHSDTRQIIIRITALLRSSTWILVFRKIEYQNSFFHVIAGYLRARSIWPIFSNLCNHLRNTSKALRS